MYQVEDNHEAIIDVGTFQKVQEEIKRRTKVYKLRENLNSYVFRKCPKNIYLNKRRQKNRRFERRGVEFAGSEIIKSINKDFKNSFHSINRPKETFRFTSQRRDIMSQVRINTFYSVGLTFVF